MRFRDQVGLTLPALILRLALCLIFFWAGLGKILGEMTVTGDDAARLAAMGVHLTPTTPEAAPVPTPAPARTPDLPPAAPGLGDAPAPNRPLPSSPDGVRPGPAVPDAPAPDRPAPEPVDAPTTAEPDGPNAPGSSDVAHALSGPRWLPVQHAGPTADDLRGAYSVQRLYGIALVLSRAGDPGLSPESRPIPRTMPAWVAADRWPVILAWAAAGTELLAAAMLLFGVLTRFGALLIVGVMLQAMWLTQIGPAAVGREAALAGFLPAAADPWDPGAYQALFFQLCCLVMALAVFLLGSGPIGFDRALFRPAERLERTEPGAKRRTSFDRQPTDTP